MLNILTQIKNYSRIISNLKGENLMKFILHQLALETTRKCNMKCDHCMRGLSQDIELSPEMVDSILENKEIERIDRICFSGGEPTLNPNIIIYTINKIIKDYINVGKLIMLTNGLICNRELIDAFNRFNEYRNKRNIEEIMSHKFDENCINQLIKNHTDNHVRITFSTDQFHQALDPNIENEYLKYSKGLNITKTQSFEEKDIYKTGFATIGKDFNYKLETLRYSEENGSYFILDHIYLTATGYLTSEGMGQYTDMDKINMGSVYETSITDILINFGKPIFKTAPITSTTKQLKIGKK